MSPTLDPRPDLAGSAKRSWQHFLETYEHGQLAIFPNTQHGGYLGVAESPHDPRLLDLGVTTIERFLTE